MQTSVVVVAVVLLVHLLSNSKCELLNCTGVGCECGTVDHCLTASINLNLLDYINGEPVLLQLIPCCFLVSSGTSDDTRNRFINTVSTNDQMERENVTDISVEKLGLMQCCCVKPEKVTPVSATCTLLASPTTICPSSFTTTSTTCLPRTETTRSV